MAIDRIVLGQHANSSIGVGLFVSQPGANVMHPEHAQSGNLMFDSTEPQSTLNIIQSGTFKITCSRKAVSSRGETIGTRPNDNQELLKKFAFTLLDNIATATTVLPSGLVPAGVPIGGPEDLFYESFDNYAPYLQIDDEIIKYHTHTRQEPGGGLALHFFAYVLSGRGQLGTTAAPHSPGADVLLHDAAHTFAHDTGRPSNLTTLANWDVAQTPGYHNKSHGRPTKGKQSNYLDTGSQTIQIASSLPNGEIPKVALRFAVGNSSGHFHPWYANTVVTGTKGDWSDIDYASGNTQQIVHMDSNWMRLKWGGLGAEEYLGIQDEYKLTSGFNLNKGEENTDDRSRSYHTSLVDFFHNDSTAAATNFGFSDAADMETKLKNSKLLSSAINNSQGVVGLIPYVNATSITVDAYMSPTHAGLRQPVDRTFERNKGRQKGVAFNAIDDFAHINFPMESHPHTKYLDNTQISEDLNARKFRHLPGIPLPGNIYRDDGGDFDLEDHGKRDMYGWGGHPTEFFVNPFSNANLTFYTHMQPPYLHNKTPNTTMAVGYTYMGQYLPLEYENETGLWGPDVELIPSSVNGIPQDGLQGGGVWRDVSGTFYLMNHTADLVESTYDGGINSTTNYFPTGTGEGISSVSAPGSFWVVVPRYIGQGSGKDDLVESPAYTYWDNLTFGSQNQAGSPIPVYVRVDDEVIKGNLTDAYPLDGGLDAQVGFGNANEGHVYASHQQVDGYDVVTIDRTLGPSTTWGASWRAFNVEGQDGLERTFSVTSRASTSVGSGHHVRIYEYDEDMPADKFYVGAPPYGPNTVTATRVFVFRNFEASENVSLDAVWKTRGYTYTPTNTAKWASVGIFDWNTVGSQKIYVQPIHVHAVESDAEIAVRMTYLPGLDAQVAYDSDDTNAVYLDVVDNLEVVTIDCALDTSGGTENALGAAWRAFQVNDNYEYRFNVTAKMNASSGTGCYIRVYEYSGDVMPPGKFYINKAGVVNGPNVQDSTLTGPGPSDSASQEPSGEQLRLYGPGLAGPLYPKGWTTRGFTYTPTSGAKWASVVVINWNRGTFKIHVLPIHVHAVNRGVTQVAGKADTRSMFDRVVYKIGFETNFPPGRRGLGSDMPSSGITSHQAGAPVFVATDGNFSHIPSVSLSHNDTLWNAGTADTPSRTVFNGAGIKWPPGHHYGFADYLDHRDWTGSMGLAGAGSKEAMAVDDVWDTFYCSYTVYSTGSAIPTELFPDTVIGKTDDVSSSELDPRSYVFNIPSDLSADGLKKGIDWNDWWSGDLISPGFGGANPDYNEGGPSAKNGPVNVYWNLVFPDDFVGEIGNAGTDPFHDRRDFAGKIIGNVDITFNVPNNVYIGSREGSSILKRPEPALHLDFSGAKWNRINNKDASVTLVNSGIIMGGAGSGGFGGRDASVVQLSGGKTAGGSSSSQTRASRGGGGGGAGGGTGRDSDFLLTSTLTQTAADALEPIPVYSIIGNHEQVGFSGKGWGSTYDGWSPHLDETLVQGADGVMGYDFWYAGGAGAMAPFTVNYLGLDVSDELISGGDGGDAIFVSCDPKNPISLNLISYMKDITNPSQATWIVGGGGGGAGGFEQNGSSGGHNGMSGFRGNIRQLNSTTSGGGLTTLYHDPLERDQLPGGDPGYIVGSLNNSFIVPTRLYCISESGNLDETAGWHGFKGKNPDVPDHTSHTIQSGSSGQLNGTNNDFVFQGGFATPELAANSVGQYRS